MLIRVPKHVTGTEQRTCGPDEYGSGNLRLWEIVSFSRPTPCTSTSAPSAAPARSRSTSRRRSNPYCALTLWGRHGRGFAHTRLCGFMAPTLCPSVHSSSGLRSRWRFWFTVDSCHVDAVSRSIDGFSCGGPCTEAAVSSLTVGNDQNPRLDEEYG